MFLFEQSFPYIILSLLYQHFVGQGVINEALSAMADTDEGMNDDHDDDPSPTGVAGEATNEKLAAVSELRFLNGQWAELELDLLTYGTSNQETSTAAATEGTSEAAANAGKTALELYQECAANEEEHLYSTKKNTGNSNGRGSRDPYLALASLCDKLLSQWEACNHSSSSSKRRASLDNHHHENDSSGGPFLFDPTVSATEVACMVVTHTFNALRMGQSTGEAMAAIPRCVCDFKESLASLVSSLLRIVTSFTANASKVVDANYLF